MEKKWALVTGASSGIGLAYAEELASLGYQLVIVSNEEQAIREKGEFLSEKYGIEVLPLYRDLAIPGAAKELYDTCQEKNIPIEVLVNNAGMFFFCETLQAKANIVEKMLYLHVTTPTQLCYYFGQEMKKRRLGYILAIHTGDTIVTMPTIATGVLVFFHTVDEARLVHQGTCHGHKLEPVVQYLLDHFLEILHNLDKETEAQGLRAFVWNIEKTI